jgi:hypothetical protein
MATGEKLMIGEAQILEMRQVPLWAADDLPACTVGIDLLLRFKEARPNDYTLLQTKDLVDSWEVAGTHHAGYAQTFTEHASSKSANSSGY